MKSSYIFTKPRDPETPEDKQHTWLGAIDGTRLADELIGVEVVQVHALRTHMLVRAAAHHLKGLLLGAGPVDHSVIHLHAHGP